MSMIYVKLCAWRPWEIL